LGVPCLAGLLRRSLFTVDGVSPAKPTFVTADESCNGQRVDTFLHKQMRIPGAHIYKILREGKVRVNQRQVDFSYKLMAGDLVRLPAVRVKPDHVFQPKDNRIYPLLYEDDKFLAVDKPPDSSLEGGTGEDVGVIECLKYQRPELKFLCPVYRTDKGTSGVLLLAKSHFALNEISIKKTYTMKFTIVVCGEWNLGSVYNCKPKIPITRVALAKRRRRERYKDMTVVKPKIVEPTSIYYLKQLLRLPSKDKSGFAVFSLLELHIDRARTHEIRVQLGNLGFPILKDTKYGIVKRFVKSVPPPRLFLHAHSLSFVHPFTGATVEILAPLPVNLSNFIQQCTPTTERLVPPPEKITNKQRKKDKAKKERAKAKKLKERQKKNRKLRKLRGPILSGRKQKRADKRAAVKTAREIAAAKSSLQMTQ